MYRGHYFLCWSCVGFVGERSRFEATQRKTEESSIVRGDEMMLACLCDESRIRQDGVRETLSETWGSGGEDAFEQGAHG